MSERLGWRNSDSIDVNEASANRHAYAKAVDVNHKIVYRWSAKKQQPWGINLIRFVYSAAALGINISTCHFDNLSDMAKKVGYILVFRLLDLDILLRSFNVTETVWFIDLALGRSKSMSPDRQKTLDDFLRRLEDDISERVKAQNESLLKLVKTTEDKSEAPISVSPASRRKESGDKEGSLSGNEFEEAYAHITLLRPLLDRLVADNSPKGLTQRQSLRGKTVENQPVLFTLSTTLNRLCSERVRDTFGGTNEKNRKQK